MPSRLRVAVAAATAALAVTTSACGDPAPAAPSAGTSSAAPTTSVAASPVPTTTGASTTTTSTATTPTPTAVPAGVVVVLDPGHNGGNGSHPAQINRQVPDGRGHTKACNTTGTSTNAGYPEHAFTWDVAVRVRGLLAAKGVTVVMTREDDSGVGPCVDARAATGNNAAARAVVSIHADGSTGANDHGFHVAYSSPPLNAAQGEPSQRLARGLRDALTTAGFATSNYVGTSGLSPRTDLAGLNLSQRPVALVECGNMRNAGDAATLSSADGRQRYATAIAAAIMAYVS